ncbi:MAG: hypothetical protein WD063_21580 [Pirellulales bacterium]
MRIDHTRIAVRERSWLDNLDLALHVIRAHAGGLFASALVGVLPMTIINYAIIDYYYGAGLGEGAGFDAVTLATILVMIEAPLATAPLTLYLGQAMFLEQPSRKQMARQFVACLPQLILFQLIVRTVLIVPILTWIIPYVLWPYLNEVILLERNPLVGHGGQLSTMKRNSLLHHGNGADYVIRGIFAGLLAVVLILALWTTQSMALNWLLGFDEGWPAQIISLQCVLWLVAVYFTVARFLNYLGQRIRNEGWEVELYLRAQRERLTRHVA